MGIFIVIIISSLVIVNFVWAILNIKSNEPHRLLWHLLICFFPIIGPLIFMANKKKIL